MSNFVWLAIIIAIILAWYLWNKYGALYMLAKNNPEAVHLGQSVARYATDIEGLIGAADSANNVNGGFMSRLGAFTQALPT
jgi:ABC-type glucose/galactose transport system permease subunit